MSFERALAQNPPPSGRVGDISLRYDPPVLVGETRRAPGRARLLPEVALLGALGSGLGAVGALVTGAGGGVGALGGGGTGMAAVLAACGGALLLLSQRLDRRARDQRRFVLHFGTETLRVDTPRGLRGASTRSVPFDAVVDLYVLVDDAGRHALWAEVAVDEDAPPRAVLLVDGVPEAESDALRRLWTTLRSAFGLRPPGQPKEG